MRRARLLRQYRWSRRGSSWPKSGLPILAYSCLLVSAVAFAADVGIADEAGAIAPAILLVTALRISWMVTVAVLERPKSE